MTRQQFAVVALAVTGLAVTVGGIVALRRELDMIRTWIPVPANVNRAWVQEHHGDDDESGFTVGYEFTFNYGGQDRRAQANSPDTHSRAGAEKLVSAHFVGSGATIRVNPANPDEVNPNLDANPATLAGPLWLILLGVTLLLLAPPLWLLAKPQDLW